MDTILTLIVWLLWMLLPLGVAYWGKPFLYSFIAGISLSNAVQLVHMSDSIPTILVATTQIILLIGGARINQHRQKQ